MQYPEIHIAVVHNREGDSVRRCLASLAAVYYPDDKLTITIVDSVMQEDGLAFISSEFSNVRVIDNKDGTYSWFSALAENIGTDGLLAIISAEVTVNKDFYNKLVVSMGDDETVAAVTGRVLLQDGTAKQPEQYDVSLADGPPGDMENVSGLPVPALYRYGVLKDILAMKEYGSLHMGDMALVELLRRHNMRVIESPESITYLGTDPGTVATELIDDNQEGPVTEATNEYVEKSADPGSTKYYPTLLEQGRNGLSSVVSDIVWKMQSKEDAALLSAVLPGVFDGMKKVLALEKDYLSSKMEVLEKAIDGKDSYLEEQREMNKTLHKTIDLIKHANEEKSKTLSDQAKEIDHLKTNLTDEADEREREYVRVCERDKLIREKDRMVAFMEDELRNSQEQVKEKSRKAEALSKEINEIYSSVTYRLLVRPLWKVLNIAGSITGNRKILFFSLAVLFCALILVAVMLTRLGIQWGILAERIADFGMGICNLK